MEAGYLWITTLTALTFLAVLNFRGHHVTGQLTNGSRPSQLDCQQKLLVEVYSCVTDHQLDFNLFLSMVSGAQTGSNNSSTSNTPASVNPPSTGSSSSGLQRDKLCGPRQEIMNCILKAAQSIISSTSCEPMRSNQAGTDSKMKVNLDDPKFLMHEQLEAMIGQYDVFCAHPCRISLLDEMRSCYSKHNLDSTLFLTSDPGGPAIGVSSSEVARFCKNRDPLVGCLQKTRDDCQESQIVLGSIGLDLELMGKGLQLLCSDTETYLKSLNCFDSHTKEVELCHSVKYRAVLALAKQAKEDNLLQDKYYQELCGIILQHVRCDLDAWAGKSDQDCSQDTLELKRKLHCTRIPAQCMNSHNTTVAQVCATTPKPASACVLNNPCFLVIVSFLFVLIFWS